MKRLVLVDGNALLHRAYHATPPLTTSKGELINAVFGFTSMILKELSDLKPDYMAITWDEKGPTFRHQAYTQYKATREPTDNNLTSQYKRIHEVIDLLNIPEFSVSGYEADDLIGTLALQAKKKENLEIIILTGDRDIMQLIDSRIKVLMPRKTLSDIGLYGEEEFVVRYGFMPKQIIEYKALAGDASDNIPGVQGIGEVSATKLIQKFENIEKIYLPENLKSLPERMQKLLAEGAESAVMSKQLATLDLDAPIKLELSKCVVSDYEHGNAEKLFEELEFKSLIARLPGNANRHSELVSESQKRETLKPFGFAQGGQVQGDEVDSGQARMTQNKHTTELDLAVTPILQKMTQTGVLIDLKFLEKLGKGLKKKLIDLEKDIYKHVGHEFNLNSPKQLQVVLFDELNLPVVRKTKTGRSTDEATLNELSSAHPMIPLFLEYRQLFKLVSTYIDTLPSFADSSGRVHSTFNVEGSATGRLSSKDPNLQNIPIRGQMGGEIRKAFIAPKGKVLLTADYSQIELRIMAHLSGDKNLEKAFKEEMDIHSATAAKIFNVSIDKVTKEQRTVGKTMNFATLYGQGPHALSRQLGVEYALAQQYIAEYFERFPKVREWMQKTLEKGYKDGYVETLWGRKRYIPELTAGNRMLRSAGERAAINHPVQGTAADMIKKAMVEIGKELSAISLQSSDKENLKADSERSERPESCSLILQVHDELLFECTPRSLGEVGKMVKEKMENALKLSVPVVVDLKVGKNWGEMKAYKT